MLFGAEDNKGLRLKPGKLELEIVTLEEDGITTEDLLVHDETNRPMAFLLAAMEPPSFPIALGVLFRETHPSYETSVLDQVAATTERMGEGDLETLFNAGHTWTVE